MAQNYPVAGQSYTIVQGDCLWNISATAYGTPSKWPKIWRANQKTLRSTDPNLIYPGEVIFIPLDEDKKAALETNEEAAYSFAQKNSVTMVVDGLAIPVISARLKRSLDTMVDQYVCEIPWMYGLNAEIDKRVAPFSYAPTKIYFGGSLVMTGKIYNVRADKKDDGTVKVLEVYPNTVDLADSTMPPPFYFEPSHMDSVAKQVAEAFGIQCTFLSGRGHYFDQQIDYEMTEPAGKFLERLAFQSSQFASNDPKGNLVFQDAHDLAKIKPVGTLDESEPWGRQLKIEFNGRERFGVYTAYSCKGDAGSILGSDKDPMVPQNRQVNFYFDDLDKGNINASARWKRNKQLIKTLTIPIPLTGWYNPAGTLWNPGQMVVIKSPTLHCPNGFAFMVREVEHVMENNGFTCTLMVCPPAALTGDMIQEPWGNNATTGSWTVTK